MIDASKPADEQWRTIDAELAAYGAGLDELPQIVVLNKIDLEPEPEFGIDDERIVAVFRVSCATGEGIDELRSALFTLVPEPASGRRGEGEVADFLVYRPEPKARPWSLLRTEDGFRVVGHAAERGGARARAARGRRAPRRRRSRSARSRSSSCRDRALRRRVRPAAQRSRRAARRSAARARPRRDASWSSRPSRATRRSRRRRAVRLELARAAFPGETVVLDEHAADDRHAARPSGVGGGMRSCSAPTSSPTSSAGRSPRRCCGSCGSASRRGPASPRAARRGARPSSSTPERVAFFELEPLPIASRELRARLDRGEDVHELVPAAVWELIERDGLYGRAGYTGPA